MRSPRPAETPATPWPGRLPFFYGWLILVVATVGVLMSIPGQTMGVSVFTDSLIEATGLDRLAVSNAYLVGTLLSGVSLPLAGSVLDRVGARMAGAGASVLLGASLLYLSWIDRIVASMAPWATAALLAAGFYVLRLAGQGSLTMVSRTLIGRWFDRRRGLASGLSGVVVGFGFGYAPRLLDAWIEAASWRGAWQQMAWVVSVGMGLVALVFFRDSPEACGLRMDGRREPSSARPQSEPADVELPPSYTRAQASRTLSFWAVSFALSTQSLVLTALTFHIVDLGASAGLDRSQAVAVFLPLAVVSTIFGLISGLAADRMPLRLLIAVMMAGEAIGLLGAFDLSERSWMLVLGFGTSGGLFGPISTVAFPRLFGRRHLGAIVGVEMMCLVIASALGPALFAASRQYLGGYDAALALSLLLPAAASIVGLGVREPSRPAA